MRFAGNLLSNVAEWLLLGICGVVMGVVVLLTLPFVPFIWLDSYRGRSEAAAELSSKTCATCGAPLAGITRSDVVEEFPPKVIPKQGAPPSPRVWPSWMVTCPACATDLCFNSFYRSMPCPEEYQRRPTQHGR